MEPFEVTVCCLHGKQSEPVPCNLLTLTCQPGDQVLDLKRHVENASPGGQRPTAQQVLVVWGEELADDVVLSQLEPTPTSVVVMMKDQEPTLDTTVHIPSNERAGIGGMSADSLLQMLRGVQAQQPQIPADQLPQADEAAVKSLTEMGFTEQRAQKALLLNGNNIEAAMEWLFQHSDDPDIDVPLTPMQMLQLAGGAGAQGNLMRMLMGGGGGMFGGGGGGAQPAGAATPAAAPAPAAPTPAAPNPQLEQMLRGFEPLLSQAAAVANGDSSQRASLEQQLPVLQERGWQLQDAIQALWAGERNLEVLQRGTDTNSAQLIVRMLELTNNPGS